MERVSAIASSFCYSVYFSKIHMMKIHEAEIIFLNIK